MTTFIGVVLAAGAGHRHGKPKVLVDIWLDTAVRPLHNGGCTDIVLVLSTADVTAPPGVTTVNAVDWHDGLCISVRTGPAKAALLVLQSHFMAGRLWWRSGIVWRGLGVDIASVTSPGRRRYRGCCSRCVVRVNV